MEFSKNQFPVILALCIFLFVCNAFGRQMHLIRLNSAPRKHGAMCLDGSPPGFYFRPGVGSGQSKWIVHLQGGAWCINETDCALRSQGMFGSTNNLDKKVSFAEAGILSHDPKLNPDFNNWNVAYVIYCDGGSFTGYREEPLVVDGTTLNFRGIKIREAVLEALLRLGMKRATDVILTGCSAGAVSTFIHADYVKSVLNRGVKYVAMTDAGIFADTPQWREYIMGANNIHNSSGGLDADCVEQYKPLNEEWRCYQAQYAIPHVTTPTFFYNSIHDSASLAVTYSCLTPSDCPDLESILPIMREEFFNATVDIEARENVGIFFDSCIRHCQSIDDTWFRSVRVDGQLAREIFANWYFGRSGKTVVVDCEYPCNESCGVPRDIFGNNSPLPDEEN